MIVTIILETGQKQDFELSPGCTMFVYHRVSDGDIDITIKNDGGDVLNEMILETTNEKA